MYILFRLEKPRQKNVSNDLHRIGGCLKTNKVLIWIILMLHSASQPFRYRKSQIYLLFIGWVGKYYNQKKKCSK